MPKTATKGDHQQCSIARLFDKRGATTVADLGCGCVWSSVLTAKTFPNAKFIVNAFHRALLNLCMERMFVPRRAPRLPRPRRFREPISIGDLLRPRCPTIHEAGRSVDDRGAISGEPCVMAHSKGPARLPDTMRTVRATPPAKAQ